VKNLLPLFVFIASLAAVGIVVVLLLLNDNETESVPIIVNKDSISDKSANIQTDDQKKPEIITHTPSDTNTTEIKEKIESGAVADPLTSSLRVHVIDSVTKKSPPKNGLSLKLYYNQYSIENAFTADAKQGWYLAENLLPGRYKIVAITDNWESGTATCVLNKSGLQTTTVIIASPAHLKFRIVDQLTLKPVSNAKIYSYGFIDNGKTDESGFFKTRRSYNAAAETIIKISHEDYYTTYFNPLHPGETNSRKIKGSDTFQVKLAPINGNRTLSGILVDERGEPLSGWALLLDPDPSFSRKGSGKWMTAFTNYKGEFVFTKLTPGTFHLKGTIRRLITPKIPNPPIIFTQLIKIPADMDLIGRKIICQRPKVPFTGTLLNTENREPIVGATICVKSVPGMDTPERNKELFFNTVSTDENGVFITEEKFIPENIFMIILTKRFEIKEENGVALNFRPIRTSANLKELHADLINQTPMIIWIPMKSDISLEGNVCGVNGNPIPGVSVRAFSGTGIFEGVHSAYSDTSGYFKVPDLFPGVWIIKAEIPKGPILTKTVTISKKRLPPPLQIKVSNECKVEGGISAEDIPERLVVKISGLRFETIVQQVGPDLHYSFSNLPPGRAKIILEIYQCRQHSETSLEIIEAWVDLKSGSTVTKDFKL